MSGKEADRELPPPRARTGDARVPTLWTLRLCGRSCVRSPANRPEPAVLGHRPSRKNRSCLVSIREKKFLWLLGSYFLGVPPVSWEITAHGMILNEHVIGSKEKILVR